MISAIKKETLMKHLLKTTLAIALASCVTLSYAAKTVNIANEANSAITPAQKTQIQDIIHQYLLDKPEVLVEALQSFQRKQYEQAEQTVKKTQANVSQFANALFKQTNDPVAGNANGKVTVVEFFDYQCSHCVDMAPVIESIIKSNPDVRLVFKEFPIRGPLSQFAARAALAANKQGKYYELHNALLTTKQPLTEAGVFEIAKGAGLNVDQLKKDMDDKSVENQLKDNLKLAQDLKLFGTPAFFIGKTDTQNAKNINYVPGALDQKQMQDMIDKAK